MIESSTLFLALSGIIFVISAVLWKIAGPSMVIVADYFERRSVTWAGLFMFLIALALLAFEHGLPQPWTRYLAIALMFTYLLPVLLRLSSVLSGGIEKHRKIHQDRPVEDKATNPPA